MLDLARHKNKKESSSTSSAHPKRRHATQGGQCHTTRAGSVPHLPDALCRPSLQASAYPVARWAYNAQAQACKHIRGGLLRKRRAHNVQRQPCPHLDVMRAQVWSHASCEWDVSTVRTSCTCYTCSACTALLWVFFMGIFPPFFIFS